jgi:hypothetical protein
LLYRPGELVVVADQLESKAEHTIDRRLHFGPELVAAVSGSEVVASADGSPVAALFEASAVPVEVTLARGEVEPRMDGWTFPRDNTKVASDAVTLRSRLASGTLVHGVAVGHGVPDAVTVRVEEGLVTVEISRNGSVEGLRVSRSERELEVVSAPVPA